MDATQRQPDPYPHRKRIRLWLLVLLLTPLFIALWWKLDERFLPSLRAGPMVQFPAPGTVTIVWQADTPLGGEGRVTLRWTHESRSSSAVRDANGYFRATFDQIDESPVLYDIHHRGFFGRDVNVFAHAGFVAPRRPGRSFRFLAFGDSGNGSNTQRMLAEVMIKTQPDLIVHTGDLIYPKGDWSDYPLNFFLPYRELLARAAFMPSMGNHDIATEGGRPMLEIFALPKNGPAGIDPGRFYWFDFGDARFAALDSNLADRSGVVTEEQMRDGVAPWLRELLCGAPLRWKFVFLHHPPYTGSTKHRHATHEYLRKIFTPVFDECGVDVVLAGHNHLYERSHPTRGDKIVAEGRGVVYIVTGAGGVSRYEAGRPGPDFIAVTNDEVFSFTQIDVTPTRLVIQQIDETGRAIDEFILWQGEHDEARGPSITAEVPSASKG
jgi:predicted phosphodiesterase